MPLVDHSELKQHHEGVHDVVEVVAAVALRPEVRAVEPGVSA